MTNEDRKQGVRLSMDDIRSCLAQIEEWCRLLREALEHDGSETDAALIRSHPVGPSLAKVSGCPIQPKVDDCGIFDEDERISLNSHGDDDASEPRPTRPAPNQ